MFFFTIDMFISDSIVNTQTKTQIFFVHQFGLYLIRCLLCNYTI